MPHDICQQPDFEKVKVQPEHLAVVLKRLTASTSTAIGTTRLWRAPRS